MTAYLATGPDACDALGLKRRDVQPWEDGLRTDPHADSFEWWYFDAHLSDGSTLVITFFTKQMLSPHLPLQPVVTLNLDRPDGTHVQRELRFAPEEFSASTEGCDVRMGRNTFVGDLTTYRIHVEDDEISVDVTLTGAVPPWRPETGHLYFDDGQAGHRHLFAWLPAVPDGTVEATVTYRGGTETLRGVGYHDHNWGDVPLNQVVHHWWWARARVGPFTVISCHVTAEEAYGGDAVPVFMIARDGRVLADDASLVRFDAEDVHRDEVTGKPVASRQVYDYTDSAARFRITWVREQDIVRYNFVDQLPESQREAARAAGFDSSYLRFTGTATVERLDGEQVAEAHRAPAIWELMYFGRPR